MKCLWMNKADLLKASLVVIISLIGLTGCGLIMILGTGLEPPAQSEFGLGPRSSVEGLFTARLVADQPMRPRKMQSLQLLLEDSSGRAVKDATVTVDGGMPQHGHGLPTRPSVTSNPNTGDYEIEGVRFSMGGWWELKLAIVSPSGDDSITFNLDI